MIPAEPESPSLESPLGSARPLLSVERPAPILDYASPQARSRLRLPARSDLHVTQSPTELRIHETLTGQGAALLALVFALFTLACLLATARDLIQGGRFHHHLFELSLYLSIATAEVLTMLAVLDNTWRTTTLVVTPESIMLRFHSPIRGSRLHKWLAEKLHTVAVRQTRLQPRGPAFPELELDLWGEPQVRLFLGHPVRELEELVAAIHTVQPPSPSPRPRSSTTTQPASQQS